ncbi:hypothetical protein KM92DES2_12873 [uncultured Desulfovibrio sp.]|uniref:Uncharacterized protein n=1 Tax=uncultured Desulfovibrio sp. TaxID=167968 RepID=A0A212KEB6_9BACT|nr:hypothetical protein KM92DES2_12873 [uncultured Desulfovibrio sp.]
MVSISIAEEPEQLKRDSAPREPEPSDYRARVDPDFRHRPGKARDADALRSFLHRNGQCNGESPYPEMGGRGHPGRGIRPGKHFLESWRQG